MYQRLSTVQKKKSIISRKEIPGKYFKLIPHTHIEWEKAVGANLFDMLRVENGR